MMFQILAIVCVLNLCLGLEATNMYWTEETGGLNNVGLKKCQPNEYPFMVFFTDKKCTPSLCSGSLISTEWVLTSKECVEKQIDINNCLVIAGTIYLSNTLWDEKTITFLCLLAATHSDANLGLVKIETVDPFPDHIYLIHYHKQPQPSPVQDTIMESTPNDAAAQSYPRWLEDLSIVLGYQSNQNFLANERTNVTRFNIKHSSASLKKLVLPLLAGEECEQNISELFHEDSAVCTVCDFGGTRTCFLDMGGPLLYKGQLLGVVSGSYSRHCFLRRSVAVYTKVATFESWINGTLQIGNTMESTMHYVPEGLETQRDLEPNRSGSLGSLSPLLIVLSIVVLMRGPSMDSCIY